jgi:hypothetical protein
MLPADGATATRVWRATPHFEPYLTRVNCLIGFPVEMSEWTVSIESDSVSGNNGNEL